MGIDIYLNPEFSKHRDAAQSKFHAAVVKRDKAKTKAAKDKAQEEVEKWHDAMYAVGYLREAYHGGPYVTRYLLAEAFNGAGEAAIPAATLRARLPATVLLAIYRNHVVYEQPEQPGIINLDGAVTGSLLTAMAGVFGPGGAIEQAKTGRDADALVAAMTPEQLRQISDRITKRDLPDHALWFVEFVDLCERKEAETGQPCVIEASY